MDNAQKAIMIGVGLFITIIIISAVMLITSAGSDMINNSTDQVGNISSSLQAQLTSQYDETVLNGSQVISAVKANYTTDGFIIKVKNGKTDSATTSDYGRATGTLAIDTTKKTYSVTNVTTTSYTPTAVGKLTDTTNQATFVSSTGKYRAHLIKMSSSVVGLYFEAI